MKEKDMTNEEILKKAIEKAVKGGFKGSFDYCGIYCEMACDESGGNCVYTTIFNHEFAKAFLGRRRSRRTIWRKLINIGTILVVVVVVEYFLEVEGGNIIYNKMVLEEEPLKYLKKLLTYLFRQRPKPQGPSAAKN